MALTSAQQQALEISLGLDTDAARKALDAYTEAFNRDYKKIERANKKHNQKLSQFSKEFWNTQNRAAKAQANALKQEQNAQKQIIDTKAAIIQKQRELDAAMQSGSAASIAMIKEEIKYLREKKDEFEDAADKAREIAQDTRDQIEKMLEADFEFHVSAATKEIGEGIGEAFSSFASKDAFGIGAGMGKAILATMKKSGASMITGGTKMIARGEEKGGAAGGALKAIGSVLKGFGTAINAVGKLAPVLGLMGSALMAVVKLFLDAEANFKEFNKGILEAGGSMEYLAAQEGNVMRGAIKLEGALNQTFQEAVDLTGNLAMGINKEVHQQVLSTLGAEGMGLYRVQKSIEQSAQSGQYTVDSFAKIVQMNVAYSRAMGVSLQEVSQLQGQLATQTGMSMEEMDIAFSQMARGAAESGIASNQFFSIIRGVSSDLALYNNRIGDAVKMLTKLGKAMSAKSAEKFMNTISNAVRGMGRVQRLQVGLLAGQDKVAKITAKDQLSHAKGLAAKISKVTGASINDMAQAYKKDGAKGLRTFLKDVPKEHQGALSESLSNLEIKEKMSKKGIYGMSQAAAEGGVAAQADLMNAALSRFAGGKSLSDAVGEIGVEQMAENLGVSREQLNQMIMFNDQMDLQKEELKKAVAAKAAGKTLDPAQQKMIDALSAMGVDVNNAQAASAKIDKMGNQELLDSMEEDDRKALEEATKIRDYAKETAGFQTSLLDKIQAIMDFLLHEYYKLVMNIWESLMEFPGVGSDEKKRELEMMKAEAAAPQTEEVKKLAKQFAGDPEGFKKALQESSEGKLQTKMLTEVVTALKALSGQEDEIIKQADAAIKEDVLIQAGAEEGATRAEVDAGAAVLKRIQQETQKKIDEVRGKKEKLYGGHAAVKGAIASEYMAEGKEKAGEWLGKALSNVGLGQHATGAADSVARGGMSIDEALTKQNLTGEQAAKVYEELARNLTPEELARAMGTASKDATYAAFKGINMDQFVKEGLTQKSIYTHDVHMGETLERLLGGGESADPEADLEEASTTNEYLSNIEAILKTKGIRINQSHLNNDVKRVLKEGTLEAMEEALFEFGMIAHESAFKSAIENAREAGADISAKGILQYAGKQGLAGGSAGTGTGGGGGGGAAGGSGAGGAAGAPGAAPPAAPAAGGAQNATLTLTNNIVVEMAAGAEQMIKAWATDASRQVVIDLKNNGKIK